MITSQKFIEIKAEYGLMSSWAIWSDQTTKKIKSGMEDISFFENPTNSILNTLNPNIVLVGLNISRPTPEIFENFHPKHITAHDYKNRYALKDTMFWGAYMTDIIKNFPEKESQKIMKYLKNNKNFLEENIKTFEQELIDIGSKNPIIIAFGKDSYNILNRNLKNIYKIYKVTHYSAAISMENLRIEFENLETKLKII